MRLAARAAAELAEGRPVHTADLVISLRDFIRGVLDLEPVPPGLAIPRQGPARPAAARGGKGEGDARGEKSGGGKDAGGGAMLGAGMGAGVGLGIGGSSDAHEDTQDTHE